MNGTWTPVSVSSGGDFVLVRERDKGLAIWSPAGSKPPAVLPEAVLPAVFSPDSKTLAVCGSEFAVQLWDLLGDKQIANLAGHEHAVDSLVFAPDIRTFVSASHDATGGTLKLWDVPGGRERASLIVPPAPAYMRTDTTAPPVFTQNGKTVVWLANGMLKRLEVETGKEVATPPELQNGNILAMSPDCRMLVVTRGGDHSLADTETGRVRATVVNSGFGWNWWFTTDGKSVIHGLPQLSAKGTWTQLNAFDTHFQVVDAATGQVTATYLPPLSRLRDLGSPNPLDRKLLVRQRDANNPSLTIADAATGRQLGTLESPAEKHAGRSRLHVTAALAAFSPDGKVLATVDTILGEPNVVRLWDVATGTVRETLSVRQQFPGILRLVFDADGRRLFALTTKELHRCDLATSKISVAIPLISGQSLGITRDGKRVAYAAADEVRLFDVDADRAETVAKIANVTAVELAPDGKVLVVVTRAGNQMAFAMRLFDLNTKKELWSTNLSFWGYGAAPIFSADGRTLAAHSNHDAAKIWDVTTGKERGVYSSFYTGPLALAPDGKSIAVTKQGGQVSVYDVATGKELHTLPPLQHAQGGTLQFAPDGKNLLLTSNNSNLCYCALWSPTADTFRTFRGRVPAHSIAISPDDKLIALGGSTFNAMALTPLTVLERATAHELSLGLWQLGNVVSAFTPDGKVLAFAGVSGSFIRLWDFEKQSLRSLQRGHTGGVLFLAFSPDGKTLASSGVDQTVRLWNVAEGKESAVLKGLTVNAQVMAFTPDGKTLISASPTRRDFQAIKSVLGEVKVWDVATAKERTGFSLGEAPGCVAVSRDGATLAMAGHSGKVELWDVLAGKRLITLTDNPWIYAMAFSPDGKSLATAGQNDKPRLWD